MVFLALQEVIPAAEHEYAMNAEWRQDIGAPALQGWDGQSVGGV